MKKLILLAGIAAAVFGITKMMGKKDEHETESYSSGNGYAPQPQS
jgi:hypothetical protein